MGDIFIGMRGTGDFVTNERPENWRQKILELYPNGSAVLTAITSMMKNEPTDDPVFHWWTRTLSTQAGAVTSIYIDTALSTEYVYASHQTTKGIKDAVVYAKCAAATADMFREGHQVLLRDSDQYSVDINAKVVAVVSNGASSYIACKLLEADDNGSTAASYNLASVDRILVIGNVNSQGGTRPEAIVNEPTEFYNYCQIWRTALDITRTARKTKLRTRDAYNDAKKEALLYHGIEMEKSLIWGVRNAGTGANKKPEYTTWGLIPFIKTNASANVDDFSLNTDYSSETWLEAGEEWLDSMVKTIFAKSGQEPGKLGGTKFALCGAGALLGIQQLVKNGANYNIKRGEAGYGVKVAVWETIFGDLVLKVHPLFSWETTNEYSMLVVDPNNLIYRPFDDTFFKPDDSERKGGGTGKDGTEEEFVTEGGYEYHHAETFGYLNGVGRDNTV